MYSDSMKGANRVVNQKHNILAVFTQLVQSCGIVTGMFHDQCNHEKICEELSEKCLGFTTPFKIITVHATVLTDLYRPPHSVLNLNTTETGHSKEI